MDFLARYFIQREFSPGGAGISRHLEQDPDRFSALNNLAVTLERMNRIEEAKELYRKAISLRPDVPAPYVNLLDILIRKGMLDEARGLFKRLVSWCMAILPCWASRPMRS